MAPPDAAEGAGWRRDLEATPGLEQRQAQRQSSTAPSPLWEQRPRPALLGQARLRRHEQAPEELGEGGCAYSPCGLRPRCEPGRLRAVVSCGWTPMPPGIASSQEPTPSDRIHSSNPASLLRSPPPLRFGSATCKSIQVGINCWLETGKGAWWARRDLRLAAL